MRPGVGGMNRKENSLKQRIPFFPAENQQAYGCVLFLDASPPIKTVVVLWIPLKLTQRGVLSNSTHPHVFFLKEGGLGVGGGGDLHITFC